MIANRGFSYCKGACGKQIKLFGWNKHTVTYQVTGYCRKCAKAKRLAEHRAKEKAAKARKAEGK